MSYANDSMPRESVKPKIQIQTRCDEAQVQPKETKTQAVIKKAIRANRAREAIQRWTRGSIRWVYRASRSYPSTFLPKFDRDANKPRTFEPDAQKSVSSLLTSNAAVWANAAARANKAKKPYHNNLPPFPRLYQDLNKHSLGEDFKRAVLDEPKKVKEKDTWRIIKGAEARGKVIPLKPEFVPRETFKKPISKAPTPPHGSLEPSERVTRGVTLNPHHSELERIRRVPHSFAPHAIERLWP